MKARGVKELNKYQSGGKGERRGLKWKSRHMASRRGKFPQA